MSTTKCTPRSHPSKRSSSVLHTQMGCHRGGTAVISEGVPAVGTCRYYSQILALNECVFRQRQMYDFIAVIDRDEFISVRGKALKDVDLTAMLHSIVDGTPFASVGLFAGRYGRLSSHSIAHAFCVTCNACASPSCKEHCVHAGPSMLACQSQPSQHTCMRCSLGSLWFNVRSESFVAAFSGTPCCGKLPTLKVASSFGLRAGTACTAGRGTRKGWASC